MKNNKRQIKKTNCTLLVRGSDYLKCDRLVVVSGFFGPFADNAARGECEIWGVFFVLR